jgi:hypothetical protein
MRMIFWMKNRRNSFVNKRAIMKHFFLFSFFAFSILACTPDPGKNGKIDSTDTTVTPPPRLQGPAINADSVYTHIQNQVNFGPRIPGTSSHTACLDYILSHLKRNNLEIKSQSADVMFYNRLARMTNVMAQFHPERTERILLMAHWDTRPVADNDTANTDKPIDGADDGGSGTAMLLEFARILNEKDPGIGVDLLFVDAEDGGTNNGPAESWCLGSQYWGQHLMPPGYRARFGILLDMVAGKNAVFPKEGTSMYYASGIVNKVWTAAGNLGYGNSFVNIISGETTDDHLFVNMYTGIPTIDIVHYNVEKRSYPQWHHRHSDTMDIIDKGTIKMVGTVLVDVIYNEMPPVK